MLVVEIFSHAFRPVSLGIRLFANMFADHQVIEIFTDLTKVVVPVIFYLLGAFVCVVQAFVFTMLSAIYIALGRRATITERRNDAVGRRAWAAARWEWMRMRGEEGKIGGPGREADDKGIVSSDARRAGNAPAGASGVRRDCRRGRRRGGERPHRAGGRSRPGPRGVRRGLGQGRATAAAMESIGRNPNSADRIFTPLHRRSRADGGSRAVRARDRVLPAGKGA